jgi:hypothetical protein
MKRRSFLSLASFAPVGFTASASALEPDDWETKRNEALTKWREQEETVHSGTFADSKGILRLELALIDGNDKITEEIIPTLDGAERRYSFRGERLPRWLRPEDGIIKSFRFFWDGKEIPVAKRFWNDFGGCRITRCTVERRTIPSELSDLFEEYLGELNGPKVILSADGGTALIEWVIIDTGACCGHTATIRWMISKSGHLMRHRHTTPNMC